MPFLDFPNELLISIAEHLHPSDLLSLIRTNRYPAQVLTFVLHELALHVGEEEGITALQWAVSRGHESLVTLLLEKGVDVHAAESTTETPLVRAIGIGSETIVKLLLRNGAGTKMEYQVLEKAAKCGSEAIMRLLLENGAHHSMSEGRGRTALHVAARFNNEGAVRALLEKGAIVNPSGNTVLEPLCEAIGFAPPSLVIISLLLEAGADATRRAFTGYGPIHIAIVSHAVIGVVELLLVYGAKVSDVCNGGKTALHYAAEQAAVSEAYGAMVKYLLEKGADATARDTMGYTAIDGAMISRALRGGFGRRVDLKPTIDLLLDAGIDTYKRESLSHVAIWAAEEGHEEIFSRLLEHGVDLSVRSPVNGWTILHSAVAAGREMMVKQLLGMGVDISTRVSGNGNTALHVAVECRQPELVRFLLEKGIGVNAANNFGQTALDLALPREPPTRRTSRRIEEPSVSSVSKRELEDEIIGILLHHGDEYGFNV